MIQPSALGAPSHLGEWRPLQLSALNKLSASGKRVDALCIPTGGGKSLISYGYSRLIGARALVLTMTNGLLDQYGEFPDMAPVKGIKNYPCRALGNLLKCDAGPCLDGETCPYREAGCDYYDAVRAGAQAGLVRSNYDFWFAHQEEALGKFDLLICDEAHELASKLAGAAGATFRADEVRLPAFSEIGQWATWAWQKRDEARAMLESPQGLSHAERRDLRSLYQRFHRVAGASPSTWAWEEGQERGRRTVRFEPIKPGPYAEGLLWRGIGKILLMSATVRPGDMEALGLEAQDFNFFESESPIPVERRPVYWIPFGAKITAKSGPDELMAWVAKQDEYMAGRLRCKGLVQTFSYARAKFLKERSRYGRHMIIHNSDNARQRIEDFKSMKAPAILVSPIIHTGYNFQDDLARWQIIAKVPMLDTRTGIAAARQAADPLYSVRHAATTIQQMTGRVNRGGPLDYGETAIIDDNMRWLWGRHRPLFAAWWRKAFKISEAIPTFPLTMA